MENLVEFELPRDRSCAAVARRTIEQHTADLDTETLGDLKTVASELVDNAYLHGEGQIRLKLDRSPDRIRVEVIDEGRGAAVLVNQQPTCEGGFGLRIVDELSGAWGAYEGTTHVWAEIPLSAA
jgi:anti-sigma regulatory factor (Ser/Thr protein kinase)